MLFCFFCNSSSFMGMNISRKTKQEAEELHFHQQVNQFHEFITEINTFPHQQLEFWPFYLLGKKWY